MSEPLMKVLSPPPTRTPRGAEWAAAGFVWLARVLWARSVVAREPPGPASTQAVLSRQ